MTAPHPPAYGDVQVDSRGTHRILIPSHRWGDFPEGTHVRIEVVPDE